MTTLNRVSREIKRVARQVRTAIEPKLSRVDHWQKRDQPFELKFHQGENYRWDDAQFFGQWDKLFGEFMEFDKTHFGEGHVMLDVGCGSRPVFDWFSEGSEKYFLDPLLSDYCQIDKVRDYWQEKPSHTLLSQPAEQMHQPLAGCCDFINCWNVLDHTYDWRQILQNIRDYAKPQADVLLGTDFESHGLGHPGIDSKSYFFEFVEEHFETVKRKDDFLHREVALHLRRR